MTLPETAFDEQLGRYADVIVGVGVNLAAGQRLLVRAPIETAPLVRALAASAYRAGSPLVTVLWEDPQLELIRYQTAPEASFSSFDDWLLTARRGSLERGDATVSVRSPDPTLLVGQDPARIAALDLLERERLREVTNRITANEIPWCVVAAASPDWAQTVFPDTPAAEGVARLWDAIFRAVRADRPDSVAAWRAHVAQLKARAQALSERRYHALHLRAPGTDLTVGLPAGHVWAGSGSSTPSGQAFVPNLPTEEVFTAPHRERVDGVVASSRPLNYRGQLIEDFTLTFEAGRVVAAEARRGDAALQRLLDIDEGARRLGEVALVPDGSLISRSGVLYHETLFDENAACHLALGRGYRHSLSGGVAMPPEEALAAGLNDSLTHVDFMVGSSAMDIDGLDADGAGEPLMRAGEWCA